MQQAGVVHSQSFPYSAFGRQLWREREKRGIRSAQLAAKLKISTAQYKNFENGSSLPDGAALRVIADTLKVDLSEVRLWISEEKREVEVPLQAPPSAAPISLYVKEWDAVFQKIEDEYPLWGYDDIPNKREILNHLKQQINQTITVPLLPMNFLVNLELLAKESGKATKLSEIPCPFSYEENFADYLARDVQQGTYLFYGANRSYFKDSPAKDIEECINRLSMDRFEELFLVIGLANGIMENDNLIPFDQNQVEFCGLNSLYIRTLRPYLGDSLNSSHLYMGCLLQNLGELVLSTLIYPNGHDEPTIPKGAIWHFIYELHPIVSATLASHLGFPDEVCQAVLMHHHQPLIEVPSLCAAMKVTALITSEHFDPIAEYRLNIALAGMPQLKVPADVFLKAMNNLSGRVNTLMEFTSTVTEEKNERLRTYVTSKMKKYEKKMGEDIDRFRLSRGDFRFDRTYQKIVMQDCKAKFEAFKTRMLKPRKGESMSAAAERIGRIHLLLTQIYPHDAQSALKKIHESLVKSFNR